MDLELRGKTALVTGASKGIGRAVAEALAEEGCDVVIAARTKADLDKVADGIRTRFNVGVEVRATDLSKKENIDALGTEFRGVDILINNAGAIPQGTLEALDDAALREAWELKLFGYINLIRVIYPEMKAQKRGVIVNIIGGAAVNPTPGYIGGSGANSALTGISIALGKESTLFGVRVIGLHPGSVRTDRIHHVWEGAAERRFGDKSRWKEAMPDYPFNRPVEPCEVGNMVAFLASPKCSYTSGVVYSLAGTR